MEQNINIIQGNMESSNVEAEGFSSSEERAKREKVDCSHRVIEKRRRDRINNSLLQLSKLVPIEKFNKKNSGKLEKAEILEVTVHYLTQQQQQQFKKENGPSTENANGTIQENHHQPRENTKEEERALFLRGFKQCIADATEFFQDIEELDVSEGRCYRLIQNLKRQVSRYESEERDLSNVGVEQRVVWDTEESSDVSRISTDSNQGKRKNGGDLDGTPCKKPCTSNESNTKAEQSSNTSEQHRSSGNSSWCSNSETSSNIGPNSSSRNYMPFVFPNIPMFTTLPFAGGNNMPRFQTSPTQFPGYQYQQSPQYIPVALPQFPVMGVNFMPGFGMVNGEQSQNGSVANPVPNTSAMVTQVPSQSMPGLLPSGMPNGFFPSMYTNGLHANIMSMRPRDSGYESSELSSSSKASGSETSAHSFSDDSCQSYVA